MISTGLVSVSFRKMSVEDIVKLIVKAKLECVEWGGDVHVPHGMDDHALKVRDLSADNGIRISSYGSYYRAGNSGEEGLPFAKVLETAKALAAPIIRVWAGAKNWEDADRSYVFKVVNDLRRIGDAASDEGIRISLEFHGGTLTNTSESSLILKEELEGENVSFYWQTPLGQSEESRRDGLERLLPSLTNVHVFNWKMGADAIERLPLEEASQVWSEYFKIFRHFVPDTPGQGNGSHCVL